MQCGVYCEANMLNSCMSGAHEEHVHQCRLDTWSRNHVGETMPSWRKIAVCKKKINLNIFDYSIISHRMLCPYGVVTPRRKDVCSFVEDGR